MGLHLWYNTNNGVLVHGHILRGQGAVVTAPVMSDMHAGAGRLELGLPLYAACMQA